MLGSTPLYTSLQFLRYITKAKGPHSLHSPFIYHLYQNVIKHAANFKFQDIEDVRRELYKNYTLIDVIDFKSSQSIRKTISSVAKKSLSSRKFSAFLHLLINDLQAKSVLETGTCLGINTLYLSRSNAQKITTMEASVILAEMAKRHFSTLDNNKISLVIGPVSETFVPTLVNKQPEFIFLDADHRGETVLGQVNDILNNAAHVKCIVVHDINWSQSMNKAWFELTQDTRIKLTIDLFQAGLLFPNMNMEKQHFTLRF